MSGRTRREFVRDGAGALIGAGALGAGLAACGAGGSRPPGSGGAGGPGSGAAGSTLLSTWIDPDGTGQLQRGPGEPFSDRLDLAPRARPVRELARLAHLTDAHVMDPSSPARVPFLARLGGPVASTFRPQETLTAQVLEAMLPAVRGLIPSLVIQGGDLIDNDQDNELTRALTLLGGGRVHPGSGPRGYYGVQLASDPDPFYYRPDIDAPRHPGLLRVAVSPFDSRGLGGLGWLPVLGDHDALVAGELIPTAVTRALAIGDRALWELPPNLKLPDGFRLNTSGSPDGPPDPSFLRSFLAQALAGPTVPVPADPGRRELSLTEVIGGLARAAGVSTRPGPRLDYVRDVGSRVRIIVLDIVRRDGGSGGLVSADQPAWLAEQLAGAESRWVIVVSHQPLDGATGGKTLLALLDRQPRVVAAIAGHTHRNRITPRPGPGGGYWLITTASLIDFPQQSRALRLLSSADGGVVLETWMLDHAGAGALAQISRQLAYLDAAGGRPGHFSGTRLDRNVRLYRPAPPS